MLPGQIAKASIKIDRIQRLNTDYNPFEYILYGLKGQNIILVENPKTKECYEIPSYQIKEFIQLNKTTIDWKRLSNGSHIKIVDDCITEIVPISHEFKYAWISFYYTLIHQYPWQIREIDTDTFKLTKGEVNNKKSGQIETICNIHAYLPVWPLWAKITKRFNADKYTLTRMYMKINDVFYRFPYGNISNNNGVCMGAKNSQTFKDVSNIFIHWITTVFNRDYTPNVRGYAIEYAQIKVKNKFVPVTYDLDKIALKLSAKRFKRLNLIDMLYYLANVEDPESLDFLNTFVKMPKNPWEETE